jgi:serine protease Do
MGTGIIVDERGYIVTNYHVVRDVDVLMVTIHDGSTHMGEIVSYDTRHDLAVIKINHDSPLPVMPLGTSSDLMLGETVIAIGNPFGYEYSVTQGIVSSLSRDVEAEEQAYDDLIQIDAAINPGNSGGPLINACGKVIGINVAIRATAQRIAFAIPIDEARVAIARLLDIRRLDEHYHGLQFSNIKQGDDFRLVVANVEQNSPGERAGLLIGDVVTSVADIPILDAADFERTVLRRPTSEVLNVLVQRDGGSQTLNLSVANIRGGLVSQVSPQTMQAAEASSTTIVDHGDDAGIESAESSWEVIGVNVEAVEGSAPQFSGQPYIGGLRITDVRPGSPAFENGIEVNDILVGLHVWSTVSEQDVEFVVQNPQRADFSPVKFYILRDGETLFGYLDIN